MEKKTDQEHQRGMHSGSLEDISDELAVTWIVGEIELLIDGEKAL